MQCRYCGGKVVQINGAPPTCEDCKKTVPEQESALADVSDVFDTIFTNAAEAAADILDLGD